MKTRTILSFALAAFTVGSAALNQLACTACDARKRPVKETRVQESIQTSELIALGWGTTRSRSNAVAAVRG